MLEQHQRIFSWCYNTLRNEEGLTSLNALRELNKLLFIKWYYEREGNKDFYADAVSKGMVLDNHEPLQKMFSAVCEKFEIEGYFSKYEELRTSPTTCSMVWDWLRRYDLNSPDAEIGDGYDSFVTKTLKGQAPYRFFEKGVADYMIDALGIQGNEVIADYSCGYGSLLVNVFKKLKEKKGYQIYGFDTDNLMAQTAKLSMIMHGDTQSHIECCNDMRLSYNTHADIVVASMPHGGKINGKNQDAYLIEVVVEKLKYGGKAALLVSDIVLSGSQYEYVRYMLLRYGQILNITSLPTNAVKAGDAKAKCSVIFYEKGDRPMGQPIMLTKIEDTGVSVLGLPSEKNDLKKNLPLVKQWMEERQQDANDQTCYIDLQTIENWEVDNIFAKINASITGKYPQVYMHDIIAQRTAYKEKLEEKGTYRRVTVRKNQHDIVERDVVKGSEIKGKYLTPIRAGQFVVSRIGAKDGAIGIVPEELDGAYVTDEFYVLDLKSAVVSPYYLLLLLTSETYQGILRGLSRGATGLSRLSYRSLEELTIPLPPLDEQQEMVGKMERTRNKIIQMEKEWNDGLKDFNIKMFGK